MKASISEIVGRGEDAQGKEVSVYRALRSLLCSRCGSAINEGELFTRRKLAGIRISPSCQECIPFKDLHNGGEQVLDMALGTQLMSVDEWIGQYKVPDNSLLVTTTGSYYAYFSAGGVMTGFHDYSGASCEGKWIPGDLGFEKVGKALLADQTGCPSMNVFVSSSKNGKAELEHPDFAKRHPGARCETLRQMYVAESARVLELLPQWAKPNNRGVCAIAAN